MRTIGIGRATGLVALCLVAAALCGEARAACDDSRESYERVMAGAAEEWPEVRPFRLPDDFARYFMVAYNAETAASPPVRADTIIVMPLDSSESATWWFFGFADGCLAFYAEFGPAKGYHLVEQGHAMLYPGERRIEDWRGWR